MGAPSKACLCADVFVYVCLYICLFLVVHVCGHSLCNQFGGSYIRSSAVAVLPTVGFDLYRAINVNFQSHDDMQWCRVLLPGPL